jgi:hypothetical protein
MMSDHFKLVSAATEYDAKLEAKGDRNVYRLAIILEAIRRAEADMEVRGRRDSLLRHFSGRLLDVLLKAIGEVKVTPQERKMYR